MSITILDGPVGTLLIERDVPCPEPAWSAHAVKHHPDQIRRIHCEYANAGATVHTTATFRTRRETVGAEWVALTESAVAMARAACGPGCLVAGSIAPLADCYRPDLSPPDPMPHHRRLADALHRSRVDLLLVETFPHVEEALAAVVAARETGLPVWVSFTAGPSATLLDPIALRDGAQAAVARGVDAVLVNCIPATETRRFVRELAGLGVPFGAYANAGTRGDGIGWGSTADGPQRYADFAAEWIAEGATIIGGCCGTGPAHIAELRRRFGATSAQTTS